jgi:hypothetical protein
MADETSERRDGPTPNGGVYSVANFLDAEGKPCPKAEAIGMEILEYDADDRCVGRTYLAKSADDATPAPDAWLGGAAGTDAEGAADA